MTPEQFKMARQKPGLTQVELAHLLQLKGSDPGRTIRRYEDPSGRYPSTGPVIVAMELLLAGARPSSWIDGGTCSKVIP